MNRRTLLTVVSGGIVAGGAGCVSSIIEESGPIDFELLNFTTADREVTVEIRQESGETVLEAVYTISGRDPSERSATVIEEEGFTEASNGDTFAVSLSLGDAERDGPFQINCIEEEMVDTFIAEIRQDRRDREYIEFNQSTCTSGT